jgi:hypothetical protein
MASDESEDIMNVNDYTPGQRVQTHPATDTWMSGDRYGTVVKVGRKLVTVALDRSGRTRGFHPDNLIDASF